MQVRDNHHFSLDWAIDAKITVNMIKTVLDRIREFSDSDPEMAHGLEDNLHAEVLKAIAEDRCVNPKKCAKLAHSSGQIPFGWYACA
jgi:hypothetical protein